MSEQYRKAGVDIAAADALVDSISDMAAASQTGHDIPLNIGAFAAAYRVDTSNITRPLFLSCVDGVGTKLLCAESYGIWSGVGQDVVAMCLNDLACHGAQPLFFLDYLAVGKLDVEVSRQVVSGIAKACLDCQCALIGGETAELPGMLPKNGLDVAGFAVGIVSEDRMWHRDRVKEGDVILGCAANGLHSNGFSLVRAVLEQLGIDYSQPLPSELVDDGAQTWGELLLRPTRLYGPSFTDWIKAYSGVASYDPVRAAAHITGGGVAGNLARIMPKGLQAQIQLGSWPQPKLYDWLHVNGKVSKDEMYKVWNMGLGFVLIVAASGADKLTQHLRAKGERVSTIGVVRRDNTDTSVIMIDA